VAILNAVYMIIKEYNNNNNNISLCSFYKLCEITLAQNMVIRVSIVFKVKHFIGSKYASPIFTCHAARVYYLHHLTVVVSCLFSSLYTIDVLKPRRQEFRNNYNFKS